MKRALTYLRTALLPALAVMAALVSCSGPKCSETDALPEIYPDYREVTVPDNIAPLNFKVPGADKVIVKVVGTDNLKGKDISIRVRGKYAAFPSIGWHRLLSRSNSGSVKVEVMARADGQWTRYKAFDIFVSDAPIDQTLVYRRLDPGYELYAKMGIYQRDLSSWRERVVYRNDKVAPGCINCHSFAQCDPQTAQLHLRGEKGGTLVCREGRQTAYNMKNELTLGTVYPYWHPDGRFIAYSVNDIRQSFHNVPDKVLEVYDLASDIVIFDTEKEEILVYPQLQDSSRLETFPAFSPDGKTLYFCSAATDSSFQNVRYDLCCIDFNPETREVGQEIRTLWSAKGKSASFPRPSYDSKSIVFTVSDFGNFSIWHPEADLWTMDLSSGECKKAEELNSTDTESYHSWSNNSEWIVFSSRRDDGRHTRLYIAKNLGNGDFGKPFMLPQKDPDYNTLLLQSYNIPEFCADRFDVDKSKIQSKKRKSITARKTTDI